MAAAAKPALTDQDKFAPSKEEQKAGAMVRTATAFHDRVGTAEYPAEKGRYVLIVSWACPWAHRTLVVRALKGLEDAISVCVTDYLLGDWEADDYVGWRFHKDRPFAPHPEFKSVWEVYSLNGPYPHAKCSVPILFDTKKDRVVNNESVEIIAMLNSEFNAFAKRPKLDLAPAKLADDMAKWDALVYPCVNDGVYRCGFARGQGAYDIAVKKLFSALADLDKRLGGHRYLCGDTLTLSDIRLVTTLLRFDIVYHTHFKCSKGTISKDFPNLFAYARDLYQLPGVKGTVNFEDTAKHYYISHRKINPRGIVAAGPDLDWDAPANREHLKSATHIQ